MTCNESHFFTSPEFLKGQNATPHSVALRDKSIGSVGFLHRCVLIPWQSHFMSSKSAKCKISLIHWNNYLCIKSWLAHM